MLRLLHAWLFEKVISYINRFFTRHLLFYCNEDHSYVGFWASVLSLVLKLLVMQFYSDATFKQSCHEWIIRNLITLKIKDQVVFFYFFIEFFFKEIRNSLIEGIACYREHKTQQIARPYGSSMAERQRFGCLNTWLCNCKQTPCLWFPIGFYSGCRQNISLAIYGYI